MTEHADHATWNSHFGPFTAIARDDVVLASGWTADIERLLALISPRSKRRTALVTAPRSL